MSHTERFPRRHPLCTCPEHPFLIGVLAIDRATCAGGSIAHPVLDRDAIDRFLDRLKAEIRAQAGS